MQTHLPSSKTSPIQGLSDDAYCLYLTRRALARPAGEIGERFRHRYETRQLQLAARLIARGVA